MKALINIISLAVIIAGAYGLYKFGIYIFDMYAVLQDREKAMILILSTVLVILIIVFGRNRIGSGTMGVTSVLLEAKIQLYLKLLDLFSQDERQAMLEIEHNLKSDALLLADENVLDVLKQIDDAIGDALTTEVKMDDLKLRLVKSMRRDIGEKAGAKIKAVDDFYKLLECEDVNKKALHS